jgi:hypothetical protein
VAPPPVTPAAGIAPAAGTDPGTVAGGTTTGVADPVNGAAMPCNDCPMSGGDAARFCTIPTQGTPPALVCKRRLGLGSRYQQQRRRAQSRRSKNADSQTICLSHHVNPKCFLY